MSPKGLVELASMIVVISSVGTILFNKKHKRTRVTYENNTTHLERRQVRTYDRVWLIVLFNIDTLRKKCGSVDSPQPPKPPQ